MPLALEMYPGVSPFIVYLFERIFFPFLQVQIKMTHVEFIPRGLPDCSPAKVHGARFFNTTLKHKHLHLRPKNISARKNITIITVRQNNEH